MACEIPFAAGTEEDLEGIKPCCRKPIFEAIRTNLQHEPLVESRNRKPLRSVVSPWQGELPVWELRVGNHRVFYDVPQGGEQVWVRAVRHKPPGKTTEVIL
jgi:mRNA-degrading endonuclease RelE of RelBE toxin-antitoxin system